MKIEFSKAHGMSHYYQAKGYVIGQCLVNHAFKLRYINIPKNASSWTRAALESDPNWEHMNYLSDSGIKDYHSIIVLRNPVDRWLSGIGQYLSLYHPTAVPDDITPLLREIIFNQVAFDDHTDCQTYFITDVCTENSTFFLCDENYSRNFSKFLRDKGIVNDFDLHEYCNTTIENKHKHRWYLYFKDCLEDKQLHNKVLQYFKKDQLLIDSVDFF